MRKANAKSEKGDGAWDDSELIQAWESSLQEYREEHGRPYKLDQDAQGDEVELGSAYEAEDYEYEELEDEGIGGEEDVGEEGGEEEAQPQPAYQHPLPPGPSMPMPPLPFPTFPAQYIPNQSADQ
ncbi:hypothetical protein H4R33_003678, partial [Dimargaris cristalligena]